MTVTDGWKEIIERMTAERKDVVGQELWAALPGSRMWDNRHARFVTEVMKECGYVKRKQRAPGYANSMVCWVRKRL